LGGGQETTQQDGERTGSSYDFGGVPHFSSYVLDYMRDRWSGLWLFVSLWTRYGLQ